MKREYILLLFILSFFESYSQFQCSGIFESTNLRSAIQIPDVDNYIPTENTAIKYVRINIHYILKEQNDPIYPGNFTSYDDGTGNTSYTGYDYANDLIKTANINLGSNEKMRMPPNNNIPVLNRKYQYILNGVFFHENNNYFTWSKYNSDALNNLYGQNIGYAINVYLVHTTDTVLTNEAPLSDAHANLSGNRFVKAAGCWERYVWDKDKPNPSGLWVAATSTLNHEVGHNLSLLHPMRTNDGYCNNNAEDYCSDTPTRGEIISTYGYDPCCGWGGGLTCSNNLMDYTGDTGVTPIQLGRIHYTLSTLSEMLNYNTCRFINSSFNMSSFSDNISYVYNTFNVPSGSSISINSYKALFINSSDVTINGNFEVQKGSILEIKSNSPCN